MKMIKDSPEIILPKKQLSLFGYENYFSDFIKLFEKNKMPNSILLSGPKGLGKSTFSYHVINYLLSKKEANRYSTINLLIHKDNISYKLLNQSIHPNFFLVETNETEKEIKIDQVKNLKKFLNKTTYSRDLKIIMIDNAECLNLSSSNALLKAIEEPINNTFFFIIYNSFENIPDTIKSRCNEFKFFFTDIEKKNTFNKLVKQYRQEFNTKAPLADYYFETPGNLLKQFLILSNENVNYEGNIFDSILCLIEKYKNEKKPEYLSFLSFYIEKFYNDLCSLNSNNLNNYFFNRVKILKQINIMKKFNLNEKNVLIWIKNILVNETK